MARELAKRLAMADVPEGTVVQIGNDPDTGLDMLASYLDAVAQRTFAGAETPLAQIDDCLLRLKDQLVKFNLAHRMHDEGASELVACYHVCSRGCILTIRARTRTRTRWTWPRGRCRGRKTPKPTVRPRTARVQAPPLEFGPQSVADARLPRVLARCI